MSLDGDHARVIDRIRSFLGLIPYLLIVTVPLKAHNQPAIAYDATGEDIRCMCKSVKKNKAIRRYM